MAGVGISLHNTCLRGLFCADEELSNQLLCIRIYFTIYFTSKLFNVIPTKRIFKWLIYKDVINDIPTLAPFIIPQRKVINRSI